MIGGIVSTLEHNSHQWKLIGPVKVLNPNEWNSLELDTSHLFPDYISRFETNEIGFEIIFKRCKYVPGFGQLRASVIIQTEISFVYIAVEASQIEFFVNSSAQGALANRNIATTKMYRRFDFNKY